MLDNGASPNEYGGRDFGYRTLLELAASRGYLELVRKLIEKEVTLVDRSRRTARNIQEPGERAANAAKLYGYFDIAATIKEAMRPPNQPSLKSSRRRM